MVDRPEGGSKPSARSEGLRAPPSDLEEERFYLVSRGDCYRLGYSTPAGARSARTCSMELLLQVMVPGAQVDLSLLRRGVHTLDRLIRRGYTVVCQEDGWMCCHRRIDVSEKDDECRYLRGLMGNGGGPW